jgi:hypothetical protein
MTSKTANDHMLNGKSLIWCVAVACLLAVGCGRQSQGPRTIPVAGTVTFKGKPVGSCQVGFRPDEGQAVRAATAVCDAAGRFQTPADRGLMVGRYTIVVQPAIILDDAAGKGRVDMVFPERYAHWDTSDLKVVVEPNESSKRITIDLKE